MYELCFMLFIVGGILYIANILAQDKQIKSITEMTMVLIPVFIVIGLIVSFIGYM